jgi:hypothetical protein
MITASPSPRTAAAAPFMILLTWNVDRNLSPCALLLLLLMQGLIG